ncbi:peptidase M50 [Gloeothece citriformis PCC 7424]|uniref:Zinc metalloprotease n=1 Tax=Gloeothece citriformis (strain PCC 7424) TaxID=65393 RepID=B7KDK2_GLOC7|nr:site-2 protease family protein [Gloeothece citriformis]ACK70304.1 peptidase M50 [Gloeothece citriformis PCC 7424]
MNGNIRVGNLFGIPFYVNPSWFLVLGLVTLSYGGDLALSPQLTGLTPWILGFVAALLLFASVVAHELGHSLVAISQGIEVKSITLFLFGGLASLGKESETPLQAFLVAIAGPVVSLLLFGLFLVIGTQVPLPTPFSAIISLLAYINLALAIFNLIPGLPLDGGNVLKSLVWKITGNPNKGVIFASRVGQVFGWLAVIIGALSILGISQVGNFWTLLIGFFLLQNAGFSAQSAKVQDTLSSFQVEEAVIPDSPIVPADLTLREFVNDYVIGKKEWKRFLVIDENQKLLGILSIDSLKLVSTSQWTEVKVKELIQPADNLQTIQSDQPLLEAVKILENQAIPQLTVIREDGTVVGLLEKSSVVRLLQEKTRVKAA